jgi:hypothetical protein
MLYDFVLTGKENSHEFITTVGKLDRSGCSNYLEKKQRKFRAMFREVYAF